jgi:glycosyltransferase involved in cell wall biosynthesis
LPFRKKTRCIGFYCNWLLVKVQDRYYIDGFNLEYLKAAREAYSSVRLLTNVREQPEAPGLIEISLPGVDVIEIPEFRSYLSSIFQIRFIVLGFWRLTRGEPSFLFVRCPEPFSWLIPLFANKLTVVNYHFSSIPLEVIIKSHTANFFNVTKGWVYYILFLPEYILIIVAAYLNQCSVNGPAALKALPKFMHSSVKVLIESTARHSSPHLLREKQMYHGPIRVLCVSRLVRGKGIDLMVRAIKSIVDNYPEVNIQVTIAGDGAEKDGYISLAREMGLTNVIYFVGHISHGEELTRLYLKNEIFVSPSLSETGPRTLLEAMAHKLFCIATDVGFAAHLIKNKSCGILVQPDRCNELVAAIMWAINNRTQLDQHRENAYAIAVEHNLDSFIAELSDQK